MYAYGPVPSRRLGRSIGVSPIPAKVCPYSCVYCQLGRTARVQTERESFFPKEDILADIERVVSSADSDYVTFVGDGEPTLCADLGWLIRQCKARWPVPVAVITNGALISRADVMEDLLMADVVLPSLDAPTESLFRKINRPHPSIVFQDIIQSYYELRSRRRGQIWTEVMLVRGVNDTDRALRDLKATILNIQPDRVDVSVPIRPPAEPWVKIPEPRSLIRAMELLSPSLVLDRPELGVLAVDAFGSASEAILQTCSRHPLREQQARVMAAEFDQGSVVDTLQEQGRLVLVEYGKHRYLLPSSFVRGAGPCNHGLVT